MTNQKKNPLIIILSALLVVAIAAAAVLGINLNDQSQKLNQTTALQAETAGTLADTETTLANTQGKLTDTEITLADTQGKLADTETALADTQGKLADTETALADMQGKLTDTETALADTQGKLADTETALVDTQGKLANTETVLADTQGKLADTETALTETQGKLADTETALTETQGKLADTETALTETQAKLTELESVCEETQASQAALQMQLQEMEETLEGNTELISEMDSELAATMEKLVTTEQALVTAKNRVQELEQLLNISAAQASEAPIEYVDIKGYRLGIPDYYTSTKVSDPYTYYYYVDGTDFLMIMPLDMTGYDDWMKSEFMLPFLYETIYKSLADAFGSTDTNTYKSVIVHDMPAGYGEYSLPGLEMDALFYYIPGADDMLTVCYANITQTYKTDEIMQMIIDHTGPAQAEPAPAAPAATDAPAQAESAPVPPAAQDAAVPGVKKGDFITFGAFEQDDLTANGKEAVRWLVLAVDGEKAFVVSEKGLLGRPYHDTLTDVTWESCSMRAWMNSDLLNDMFTPEEQAAILNTTVTDPAAPGVTTEDKLFLLSETEVNTYLDQDTRIIYPTPYAATHGAAESQLSGVTWWWLRTPGDTFSQVKFISNSSFGNEMGTVKVDPVNYMSSAGWSGAVRPAMWVNLTLFPAGALQ